MKEVRSTDDDGTVMTEEKETLAGAFWLGGRKRTPRWTFSVPESTSSMGATHRRSSILSPRRRDPSEAMRLGCDVTAADLNPVAWFILKCTLDYPQQFAGKKWPLPAFVKIAGFRRGLSAGKIKKHGKATRDAISPIPASLFYRRPLPFIKPRTILPASFSPMPTWHGMCAPGAGGFSSGPRPTWPPTIPSLMVSRLSPISWRAQPGIRKSHFGRIPLLKTFWLCRKKGGGPRFCPCPNRIDPAWNSASWTRLSLPFGKVG